VQSLAYKFGVGECDQEVRFDSSRRYVASSATDASGGKAN